MNQPEGANIGFVYKVLAIICFAIAIFLGGYHVWQACEGKPGSGNLGAEIIISGLGAGISLWWFGAVVDLLADILRALRGGAAGPISRSAPRTAEAGKHMAREGGVPTYKL